ncbi:MAG: hypothetical protein J6C98_02000 [Oscillospiraceae bacterium]|nr:hypothetical protein [Oscillospiraceae bacterium]
MTNELANRIRRIFGIVLSVSIAAAGICLIWACVGIYRTGDHPFSREAVAAAFSPIAVPVYLCLALVIIGFVLDLILPAPASRRKVEKNLELILEKLHGKTDLSQCSEALRGEIIAQQRSRKLHRRITAVLLIIGSIIFLVYALREGAFHQSQINDSMVRAMTVLLPCMAVPCIWAVYAAYRRTASMEKEIALLKQVSGGKASDKQTAATTDRTKLIRNVIAVLAIAFLIYGFCTGGTADVLTKAVNICTECVGLG